MFAPYVKGNLGQTVRGALRFYRRAAGENG